MTIGTNDLREEYTATADQTVFSFGFRVFADTDLNVYKTANGAAYNDANDLITAYTVSRNADQSASPGGSITLTSGATLDDKLTIVSNVPETRTTDFQTGGLFSPELADNEFDREVTLAKQAGAKAGRAMLSPESEQNAGDLALDDSITRANKLLAFTSTGAPTVTNSTKSEIDTAVAAINAGAVTQAVNHIAMGTLAETTGAYDLVYQIANDLYTPSLNDAVTVNQYNSASKVIQSSWPCTDVNYTSAPAGTGVTLANGVEYFPPVRDNTDGKLYVATSAANTAYYVFENDSRTLSPEMFGALGSSPSSDTAAFKALAGLGAKSVVVDGDKDYHINSRVLWTEMVEMHSNGSKHSKISSYGANVSMFDFAKRPVLRGIDFYSRGQTDKLLSGTSVEGGANIKYCSFDWANGSGDNGANTGYGIEFTTTSGIVFQRNKLDNAWRDHSYDASGWDTDGSNVLRAFYVNNTPSESRVEFLDNESDNVPTVGYFQNCNDLQVHRNTTGATGDTVFFDRCTAGWTKKKRFTWNTVVSAGKGFIKTLDTNNESDTAGGEDSIVAYNTAENWGVYVSTAAIFAARNYGSSYTYSATRRNKNLKILHNTLEEQTGFSCHDPIATINIDDCTIDDCTITLLSGTDHEFFLGAWSRIKLINNKIKSNGNMAFGYASQVVKASGNDIDIKSNIIIDGTDGAEEWDEQLIIFNDNTLKTSDSDSTRTSFGLRTRNNGGHSVLIAKRNVFRPNMDFTDSSSAGTCHIASVSVADQADIDDNTVLFNDRMAKQKTIGGDILYPAYYTGTKGAAAIDETTGYIRYKKNHERNVTPKVYPDA